MVAKIKGLGGWILGLIVIAAGLAFIGICQWGYGQVRPHVPDPVRGIVGGEKEYDVDEYLASVPRALEAFAENSEKCIPTRDQSCLTKAVERLQEDIGDGVPASASWMGAAHTRLYEAIAELATIHRLSETIPIDSRFIQRTLDAQTEIEAAYEGWVQQARR